MVINNFDNPLLSQSDKQSALTIRSNGCGIFNIKVTYIIDLADGRCGDREKEAGKKAI